MSENRCVMCGDIIPEGRMICKRCEDAANKEITMDVPRHGVESLTGRGDDKGVQREDDKHTFRFRFPGRARRRR